MTPVAHDLEVSGDTVDEELKAVMKALHPQWSDEILEKHIEGLHSAAWAEAYRNVFRESEAKMTPPKRRSAKRKNGKGLARNFTTAPGTLSEALKSAAVYPNTLKGLRH